MNKHLSEDQIATYVAGRAAETERRHVAECAECCGELDRFGKAITSFRTAVRDQVDGRVATHAPAIHPSLPRATPGIPKWRWALVAAVALIFIMIPLFKGERKPQAVVTDSLVKADPDSLMQAVNLHLSRTVPEPMERMIALLPNDESITESGGVQ